jgi:tetratricopeptide (TPR) repeat protein
MARLECFREDFQAGFHYAQQAMRRQPRHPDVLSVAALSAFWRDYPDTTIAGQLVAKAESRGLRDGALSYLSAQIALAKGDIEAARAHLDVAAREPHHGPHDALCLGTAYYKLSCLILAREVNATIQDGRLRIVTFHKERMPPRDTPDIQAAVTHLRRACEQGKDESLFRRDDLAAAYYNLAHCYGLMGKSGRAFRFARKATALRAPDTDGRMLMCQLLLAKRHATWALSFIATLPPALRKHPMIHRWTANAYLEQGMGRPAAEALRKVLRSGAGDASDRYNLAVALAMADEMGTEFQQLEHEIASSGDADKLLRTVAYVLLDRGDCGTARRYVSLDLTRHPDDPWPREQAARLALLFEGLAEAEQILAGTEGQYLQGTGSVAWAITYLRRGNVQACRRHLAVLLRNVQDRKDRHVVAELIEAATRGLPHAPLRMGCRILVP